MNGVGKGSRIPLSAMARPDMWLATGLGSGLSPWAPGTMGSIVGVLFYLGLAGLSLPVYLGVVLALAIAGVFLCDRAGKALGVSDHPGIVWDEIVGVLITMTATPRSWQGVVLGFALFRLFDILKPWPVSAVDRRLHGGLGVMLDDVMAALYALASLQILRHTFEIP
jgi:phosphatidylglycerophosphatase A